MASFKPIFRPSVVQRVSVGRSGPMKSRISEETYGNQSVAFVSSMAAEVRAFLDRDVSWAPSVRRAIFEGHRAAFDRAVGAIFGGLTPAEIIELGSEGRVVHPPLVVSLWDSALTWAGSNDETWAGPTATEDAIREATEAASQFGGVVGGAVGGAVGSALWALVRPILTSPLGLAALGVVAYMHRRELAAFARRLS